MADPFNDVWPAGVPQSYGNVEFPMPEDQPAIAFIGQDITSPFFISFAIGAVFIAFFATNQFNKRSADPNDPVTIESKLLHDLTPMDLRNRRLIAQAYGLYVLVLLVVYGMLTFYGKVILEWINNVLPTAGFKTDTDSLDFASPNWPLYVALGMIGVLPALKPVEQLEVRLRRWAHRIAGVPLVIYKQGDTLRDTLREIMRGTTGSSPFHTGTIPDWVTEISRRGNAYVFEARDQLEFLIGAMQHGWGDWPNPESSQPVRRIIASQIDESIIELEKFDELVERKATPPSLQGDELTKHKASLRRDWGIASKRVPEFRDGLLALLAVCAEQSSTFTRITDDKLRDLMEKASKRIPVQNGPELAIVLALPLIFIAYCVMMVSGYHVSSINSGEKLFEIMIGALYELLLIVALYLLPVRMVLNYRYWRLDQKSWKPLGILDFSTEALTHAFIAAAIAFGVSTLSLLLLAIAQAGLTAPDTVRFWELLRGTNSPLPMIGTLLPRAGLSVIFSLAVLYAVEAISNRDDNRNLTITLLRIAILSALFILAFQALLVWYWYYEYMPLKDFLEGMPAYSKGPSGDSKSCTGASIILTDLIRFDLLILPEYPVGHPFEGISPWQRCFRFYGTGTMLIYAVLAFFSVAVFLPRKK